MWHVYVLGLVQGLSEFLPVSSSGHLVAFRYWFGIHTPGATLEIALHVGTLVAVCYGYRYQLAVWAGQLRRREPEGIRLLGLVVWGSLPAAAVGLLLGHLIQGYFVLQAVALGFGATALLLWLTPAEQEGQRALGEITWRDMLWVGFAQALAIWPGLSRSGATITMARWRGIRPEDAAQISFYLAIPVVVGASILEIPSFGHLGLPLAILLIAALIAAVSGVIAIKWVIQAISHPRVWRRFGIYVFLMAVVAWVFGG